MSSLDLDALESNPNDDREPPKRDRDYKAEHARRKARGEPSRSGRRPSSLETRLRESLEAVAGWIIERGDEELGGVLERDAPKMAAVAGKLAGTNPVAKRVVTVVADLLEPVRAFGPTLRVLYGRLVGWREARAELGPEPFPGDEQVTPEAVVGAPSAEPELAEPWRLGG